MNPRNYAASYKAVSVETSSPGQLVLMLYDGALRFLGAARQGFASGSDRERNETVNNGCIRAQNILAELQACLDMKVEGDFAKTMYSLYDYMLTRLQEANLQKTEEPIVEVEGLLTQIRDAWAEMLQQQKGEASAAVQPGSLHGSA